MCQLSSAFLRLDCLSLATLLRQMSSSVLVSLLSLSTELSVLGEGETGEKRERGEDERGGKSIKPNWRRGDGSEISKGWMARDECNRASDMTWSPRSRSISHAATETTTTAASTREPTNLGSCIVHYLQKKTAQAPSVFLTHTDTHTIAPHFISGERENRACSLLSP